MTQIKLANEIKISQPTIQKILYQNVSPKLETLIKICKYYNIDINKLINQENEKDYASFTKPDPICQQIYEICQKMPDELKMQALRYVKFISNEYKINKGDKINAAIGGEDK